MPCSSAVSSTPMSFSPARSPSCSIYKRKERRRLSLRRSLARLSGFGPLAFRLGATSFGSCLVVRHASKCPQTRMNTGFFIELPVAEYLKISPNIGSFCTQIEPAIRQILDRFSAVTPNTGDSLELSYPIYSGVWGKNKFVSRICTKFLFVLVL